MNYDELITALLCKGEYDQKTDTINFYIRAHELDEAFKSEDNYRKFFLDKFGLDISEGEADEG